MWLNLPTKIALLALVVAGAGVVGVAYVSYLDAGSLLRRQALRDIAHGVARETAILGVQIETAGQDARFLAAAPPVGGIVDALAGGTYQGRANETAEDKDWKEHLEGLFRTVLRQRPSYEQIRLIGLSGKGREVVRVERLAGKIVVTAEGDLQEKGHKRYFEEIVELGPGQLYLSEVNLNREHGRIVLPHTPTLRVGAPVFGADGRVFGALVVNVNFNTLTEAILPLTEGKKFFITNDRGDYLYHPDEGKAFAFETGGRGNIGDDFTGVDVLSDARPHGAFAGAAVEDVVSLDLPGHSVGLVFQHLHYDPANADRIFVLGAVASHSAIDRGTLKFRDRLLGLVLFVTAVLGIAIAVFTRVLTRPIRELTQVANRIAAGEEGVAVPAIGGHRFGADDEVGVLSKSMRSMLEHLEESRGELRQLAGSLEHKVEERTRDLRDSEARLAHTHRMAKLGHWYWRVGNPKLQASAEMAEIFGTTPEGLRVTDEEYMAMVHPDDRERVRRPLTAPFEAAEPYEVEYRIICPDGGVCAIFEIGEPVYDASGRIIAEIGTVQDITERKRAEEALRKSEKRFSSLVSNIVGAVYRCACDKDWTMEFMSEAIQDICGYPASDFLQNRVRSYASVIHPGDQAMVKDTVLQAVDRKQPFTIRYRIHNANGEVRWVWEQGTGVFDDGGRLRYLDGVIFDVTEQRRAEEALRQSEEKFRAVVNHSPTKIHIKDLEGRYLLVNKEAEDLFGVSDEDARGRTSAEIFPKERAEAFAAHDRAVMEAGRAIEEEEEWVREDGVHTYLTVKFPIRDGEGKAIAIGAIGTDITERKRAEEAIRESEQRLTDAIESISECFSLFDADDRLVLWNRRYSEFLYPGLDGVVVPGARFETIIRAAAEHGLIPDAQGRIDAWVAERMAQHRDPSGPLLRRRSSGRWLQISERNTEGGGTVAVYTDVTERKQTEQDLQKKDELIRAIVDNSPNEIVVTDLAGQLLLVNRKFEEFAGVAHEDALGKTFREILPGELVESALDHEREVLGAGQSITRENELSIDGEIRTFLVCKFPVPDPAGGAMAIGSISLDITERKRLERRQRHAEKMEALGVLSGGIAHEFNNMLFAIICLTESVRNSLSEGGEDRAALDGVLEGGERCKDLVRQILMFSRQDEPQARVIDLCGVIGKAHRLVRAMLPTTMKLGWDLDEACGPVLADPTQIHQILLNLASNAADAMKDKKGALLEISLDQVELDDDRTSRPPELEPGPYARLTVRDIGCGIDGDILDRIFDPFFTTKEMGRGTGMGLAAVHGIVSGLGGAVAVSSEAGHGTRFVIYLPLVDQCEVGRHAQAARSPAASA